MTHAMHTLHRVGASIAFLLPLWHALAAPAPEPAVALMDGQLMRPRANCTSPPEAAPAGWQEQAALCAWQGRLQLRRWRSAPGPVPDDCIVAPARWWAWERQRLAAGSANGLPVWRTGWTGNMARAGAPQRIALVKAGPGGAWSAVEWRWTPSARAPTQAWETERWERLAAAAQANAVAAPPAATADERAILQAWEAEVAGRPAQVGPTAARWLADGQCLTLLSQVAPEPNFHLAFAREDARLEQRAAMQVQLARRYPDATWLVPFGLRDLPAGTGTRAYYIAVWQDKTGVAGQLWMPDTDGKRPVRLRILATPGPAAPRPATALAQLVERELAALAQRLGSRP